MTDQPKKRPVADLRGFAGLKATIWADAAEQGGTRYRVTIARTYVKDGKYFDTYSMGPSDLLHAAQIATRAYAKIVELRAATREPELIDA